MPIVGAPGTPLTISQAIPVGTYTVMTQPPPVYIGPSFTPPPDGGSTTTFAVPPNPRVPPPMNAPPYPQPPPPPQVYTTGGGDDSGGGGGDSSWLPLGIGAGVLLIFLAMRKKKR